jgi:hypothetical protein
VIGYAAGNPAFAKAFRARIVDRPRAQLAGLLRNAIDKGELRAGLDVELALDVLLGPILYVRFMQLTVAPELPQHVVDSFWRLHARGILDVGWQHGNWPEKSATPKKSKDESNGRRPNGVSIHQIKIRRRVG